MAKTQWQTLAEKKLAEHRASGKSEKIVNGHNYTGLHYELLAKRELGVQRGQQSPLSTPAVTKTGNRQPAAVATRPPSPPQVDAAQEYITERDRLEVQGKSPAESIRLAARKYPDSHQAATHKNQNYAKGKKVSTNKNKMRSAGDGDDPAIYTTYRDMLEGNGKTPGEAIKAAAHRFPDSHAAYVANLPGSTAK